MSPPDLQAKLKDLWPNHKPKVTVLSYGNVVIDLKPGCNVTVNDLDELGAMFKDAKEYGITLRVGFIEEKT